MERLRPGVKMEDNDAREVNGKTIGYFSMNVPMLDDDSYNFMFFMELKGSLIIGGFSCPSRNKKEWKPIVHQMIDTIREVKEQQA